MSATIARPKRRRLSRDERRAMEQEALTRARSNPSMANFVQVIQEFAAKGIPVESINPKENVFTYNAWRALGRQVRKGEHGVKITTFVPMTRREKDSTVEGEERVVTYNRPATAVVFHVSQTDPIELVNS